MSQVSFDLTDSIEIFQDALDQLIDQIGKNVKLYYRRDIAPSSSNYDSINQSNRKPSYKDDVSEPSNNEDLYDVKTVKCTIAWQRRFNDDEDTVTYKTGRCSIKTQIIHLPDILRADFIVPNSDVEDYHNYRFRVISAPQPTGLAEDVYCKVYLEQILGDE